MPVWAPELLSSPSIGTTLGLSGHLFEPLFALRVPFDPFKLQGPEKLALSILPGCPLPDRELHTYQAGLAKTANFSAIGSHGSGRQLPENTNSTQSAPQRPRAETRVPVPRNVTFLCAIRGILVTVVSSHALQRYCSRTYEAKKGIYCGNTVKSIITSPACGGTNVGMKHKYTLTVCRNKTPQNSRHVETRGAHYVRTHMI